MERPKRIRLDKSHPLSLECRERVTQSIDSIDSDDLIHAIKTAPSLRGIVLGFVSEVMFTKHVEKIDGIEDVRKHDDHDRSKNKIDRDFLYLGKRVTVQLKSIQTNSLGFHTEEQLIYADVQNDASDSRRIDFNGKEIVTVNYKKGDYDILCTPLFPFTGDWQFAYKLNTSCQTWRSKKYPPEIAEHFLHGTEKITYPKLEKFGWTSDIHEIMKQLFLEKGWISS